MKSLRVGFAGLVIASIVSTAQAQMTLTQCLDRAKAFSLKSRTAELALRASALSRDELDKSRLPQVKFGSELSYAPSSGTFGYDPAITDGGQIGGRIGVEQSIYDGGARNLKSGQLGVEHDALEIEKIRTVRDLTFAVEELFIEALRAQRAIQLQDQSVVQLRDYLDLVQRLSKGGGASYTDVLKTQVQLQSAQRSRQKAQESLSTASYGLAELMGCALDTTFTLAGTLESLIQKDEHVLALPSISQNLDITLAEFNVHKSTFDIDLAKSEWHPTISAAADAGVLTSFDNLRLASADRAGVYGYTIGLTLEVPLFNWGATDLRVQQKQLATEGLMLQLNEVARSVNTEYRKTRLQVRRAEEALQSIQASLKSAEENYVLTKAKYASGGVLSLEVLSAQQMLTDLRLEELETTADVQLLYAKLEQITAR
jgi:outer membrane protein